MRFHLLAPPNAPTLRTYHLDGFVQATFRFGKMMASLGHEVICYAPHRSDIPGCEIVEVLSGIDRRRLTNVADYQYIVIRPDHPLWKCANERTIVEIGKRKKKGDFLLTISGLAHKPVFDAHPDLLGVEYSIGYEGNFAPFRVFESRAWQHYCYGAQGIKYGRFFDAVIPLFFDVDEFPKPVKSPGDYVLFVGRLTNRKGLQVAIQAAEAADTELRIVGHGMDAIPNLGKRNMFLGALSWQERNHAMANARAVITPTLYIEPFNAVAVEAQLCGTPVISTDWGGFTETIVEASTGFRCSYLGEFIQAIKDSPRLCRKQIAHRAHLAFGSGFLRYDYERYFKKLELLWDRGWNTT